MDLPKKLKNDALIEALVEIRFDVPDLPQEIIVGKLSGYGEWAELRYRQLPVSQMPAQLRESDPDLRFQASIEGKNFSGKNLVKIGPHVLSIHALKAYPGWESFSEDIHSAFDHVFEVLPEIKITRIGLRYINFFTTSKHTLDKPDELNLKVVIGDKELSQGISVSYLEKLNGYNIQTKLVTGDLAVSPNMPVDLVLIADIDVFTDEKFIATDKDYALNWIDEAHNLEKQRFFELMPEKLIEELKEE